MVGVQVPAAYESGSIRVCGHKWGEDVTELIKDGKFDVVILSDVIFNHVVQRELLASLRATLAADGVSAIMPKLVRCSKVIFSSRLYLSHITGHA